MYLKSLTLLGFKSFPEKTTLNFQPGVTAIVGPNGCGKSNVADAIRWVLGEQSARALRGTEMADVIFNGTDLRKPMGMAEVSLTLGGVDEARLRAAGLNLDYHELTITRRVYRDGGSEYFLNRVPCRLRDIQQLFAGTGIGRTSYSIMAQGNITQVLSSKPEDRRLVFEEAAGITRFKAQKREALRKLEATEQNLLRVSDLIREVKRQIGSLQRQAGKARRYRALQAELQHLETQLARHQYDVWLAELQETERSLSACQNAMAEAEAAVQQGESTLAAQREALTELLNTLTRLQQSAAAIKAAIEQREQQIAFNEQRIRELVARDEQAYAELARLEEQQRVTEEALATARREWSEARQALQQHEATHQQQRDAVQAIEEELRKHQELLRQAQTQAMSHAQHLARLRNALHQLEIQQQSRLAQQEKLAAEKVQLETERERLEARLAEFESQVAREKQDAELRRRTVAERQQRLREVQDELAVAAAQVDKLLQTQAGVRSRLRVLEQLEESREGYDPGALAALRRSREVLGSLADYIRVPDPYVVAIEQALGHHLQLVLTEHPEAAQGILADLVRNKAGRASIAALAIGPRAPVDESGPTSDPAQPAREGVAPPASDPAGGLTRALDVIEADPRVQPLLRSLLGRTFIVPDLATATAHLCNGQTGCDFVTLQGELLNRHGIYTGGYLNGQGQGRGPASILGRKNQIAELRAELARLDEAVAAAGRRRGELASEQTALQAGLQEAQSELRRQEVAIAGREGELRALHNARQILARKLETVIYESESLHRQLEEAAQQRAQLTHQVAAAEQREAEIRNRVEELTARVEELRRERDRAQTALSDARVALVAGQQRVAAIEQQLTTLQQRLQDLRARAERCRQDIATSVTRKEQAEHEIQLARQELLQLQSDRARLNDELAAREQERTRLETAIAQAESDLRSARQRWAALQEERNRLEIERTQHQLQIDNLCRRIQEKYQLRLQDVRSECITITYADEGPARVQVLTPEEMARAGLATDWDAVARQVETLQKRLEEMGAVNLVAIEEYEEAEQRHQFLSRQYEDLVQAKARLVDVIQRINTETRQMFLETFEQIRRNFAALFTEVFGGGSADLRLVDENDVLESGIEILARPPGKKLQTISLLSGGEQTMTAVALLFAIYQVKPSPFCVLDELDAPLDEANITRFLRILQRFLDHSQFIIITHNKRTISMADVLYGVTMEERGVSKIVSVRFRREDTPSPALNDSTPQQPGADTEPGPVDLDRQGNPDDHQGSPPEPALAEAAP
ncbi:chromosome segregation protein SMC [Limisphaera ngatamarikiensis]|uniref:Chromosome partition protein Smc n=1 Tax=Limisphaera ngatamarikiensis TaxID=1324935 RepID=A0A6M1RLU9_9BACT|nr:chromosome segregation protein SMC [Limisphaera ngatamarikiensis]NGO38437.1 chromosome segregation protein SMC [Limisphaera ngatamarikiensis]